MTTPSDPPRVCLLTGAGGLLGTAVCAALCAEYRIVAVHRSRPPEVDSQERRLIDPMDPEAAHRDPAHPVFAVRADLCSEGAVERVVELALAHFGYVDLLVNAAVRYGFGSSLANSQVLDDALAQFEVNTLLPARLTNALAVHHWRHRVDINRARNRNVINVSSVSALEAYPGQSVYAATKAALNTMTQHAAVELAQIGVRVNALAPTSFPQRIPTTSVVEAIRRLDAGEATGRILVQRETGETWL